MSTELHQSGDLAEFAKRANREHRLACEKAKLALEHAKNCGAELLQVKSLLGHGKFLPWLKEYFHGSDRTARVYMRIASNWQSIANLDTTSLTSALASLAAPTTNATPGEARSAIECEATVAEDAVTELGEISPGPEPLHQEDPLAPKPTRGPLEISSEVRRLLDEIATTEGLGRVAICDVLRYCCKRLELEVPRGL